MIEFFTKKGDRILIDDDYAHLSERSWQLNSVGYARRTCRVKGTGRSKTVLMHRLIMDAQPGEVVDHINGDKLDNRKTNLRIVTQSQNIRLAKKRVSTGGRLTTSKYIGVSKRSDCDRWWAQYNVNKKAFYSPLFKTEQEAKEWLDVNRPPVFP